ncbi:MAG TPA: DUF3347 domain-containing protein, partial [Sumerlaeia bacterium]|nr:DUF3347 domain-containing protein [Sumerlaeia bacterium]
VVTHGNFKIDSAVQILAKPSMMNPEGGGPPFGRDHGQARGAPAAGAKPETKVGRLDAPEAFRKQIDGVLAVYFRIHHALSRDDPASASGEGKNLAEALGAVDMGLLEGEAHMAWMKELSDLTKTAQAIGAADDVVKLREQFHLLSESLTAVVQRFGSGGAQAVLQFHCPMAFDNRGANWLQNKSGVENPYFGQAMFQCGEQTATLAPAAE